MVKEDTLLDVLNTNPRYDYTHFIKKHSLHLEELFTSKMLTYPYRSFVIKQVKRPLEKVIILVADRLVEKLGKVTRDNTIQRNNHILLDIREEFFKHYTNERKIPLMRSAWELLLAEYEHDSHYRWLFDWLILEIMEEIKNGNWTPIEEKFPQPDCWINEEE